MSDDDSGPICRECWEQCDQCGCESKKLRADYKQLKKEFDTAMPDDLCAKFYCVAHPHKSRLEEVICSAQFQAKKEIIAAIDLFYSSEPWTADKENEWYNLTGTKEVTTKTLCSFIRRTGNV